MKNPVMKVEKKYFTESLPIRRMLLSGSDEFEAEHYEESESGVQVIHDLFQKLQAEYEQRTLHEGRYELFQDFTESALQFADDNSLDVKIEISEALEGYIRFAGDMMVIEYGNKLKYKMLLCKMIATANEFRVYPAVINGEPAFEMMFRFELFKTEAD